MPRRAEDTRKEGLSEAIDDGRVEIVERNKADANATVLLDVLRDRIHAPSVKALLDRVVEGGITRRDLQGLCAMVVQFAMEDMADGELTSKDGLGLMLKAIEAGRRCLDDNSQASTLPGALLIQVNVDGDRSSSAGSMPKVS